MTQDVIDRIEEHRFENLTNLFWRNHDLKTTSLDALIYSLNVRPQKTGLITARKAEDQQVLEVLMQDSGIEKLANHPSRVKLLWEICQIPDFRKVSPQAHAKLAGQLFRMILDKGKIEQDWFAKQVKTLDNTNGDIDVVTGRIAGIRIWTYIAQRKEWIDRSSYWRDMTRAVEDRLSDALHQKLSQRFVDKRTSVLVKGMKTQVDLEAQIGEDGSVSVEGQTIGKLEGLRFTPETGNGRFADRVLINAADKSLQAEFQARIAEILDPEKDDLTLENDARILWKGQNLGKVVKGRDILHPAVSLTVQENIDSSYVEQLRTRLNGWLEVYLNNKILPLFKALRTIDEEGASGSVRGILYQAADQLGTIRREKVVDLVKNLTEADKKILAKTGVRMGYEYIFFPMLLKPAAQRVCALLWKIWNEKTQYTTGFAIDGKMSFAVEKNIPWALYLVQGYVLAGTRAIRVDVMERFTSKLREVTRQDKGKPQVLPLELLSIAGLKRDEAAEVFGFLGFNVTKETQTVKVGEETKETETLMIQPKFKKHKKAPKEEKIDESSPFAALAALKKK